MTDNYINRKQFPALDIMKLVMAILVIIIHRKFFPYRFDFANFIIKDVFCQIAVPFFFITSSFLFFKNVNPKEKNAKLCLWKTEKRLIILYVLWSLIYLPGYLVKNFAGHYSEITLPGLIGQLIVWFKHFLLNYSFIHLWYIHTLILTIALIFLLMMRVSPKALLVIVTPLTFFSILIVEKMQLHNVFLFSAMKLFFISGFCVSLGAFVAKFDISSLFRRKGILTAVSIILLCISGTVRYFHQTEFTYAVSIFLAYIVAFFIFTTCISSKMKPHNYDKILRNYSTLIYLCHLLVMEESLSYLASVSGIPIIASHPTIRFIITTVFAVIFSTIILVLSKLKKFKWLKWLY